MLNGWNRARTLVSLILSFISRKVSLSPIPFYILIGLFLGESGLGVVQSGEIAGFLSFLGLLFLLFYVGLELKPSRLTGRRGSVLVSGLIDLNLNLFIGFFAALALGFPSFEAFVVGSAFYISSSATAVASLIENRKLILPEAETVVWLMIFEDILIILLLSTIAVDVANPLLLILASIAIVSLFFLLARAGKTFITGLLKRDDEIPILATYAAVLSAAALSRLLRIPETLAVIALGSALSQTDPKTLENLTRPFRDVFLAVFFVFFGISIRFSGEIPILPICIISILAITSKLLSGILVGKALHGSFSSGIEIWGSTVGRGEFSIALAALYGSAVVSSTVAAMVIITANAADFTARYSFALTRALEGWEPNQLLLSIQRCMK